MTTTKTEIKVYYYGGFEKPKLLANSMKEMYDIRITSNYLGDITDDFIEELHEFNGEDLEDLNEMLSYYNLIANPTLEDLVEMAKPWFGKDIPSHHFEEFGTSYEVYEIANRRYDDFRKYYGFERKYIVDEYIRTKWSNETVIEFDSLEEATEYMDENDLWDECTLYGVNEKGRAYYPSF